MGIYSNGVLQQIIWCTLFGNDAIQSHLVILVAWFIGWFCSTMFPTVTSSASMGRCMLQSTTHEMSGYCITVFVRALHNGFCAGSRCDILHDTLVAPLEFEVFLSWQHVVLLLQGSGYPWSFYPCHSMLVVRSNMCFCSLNLTLVRKDEIWGLVGIIYTAVTYLTKFIVGLEVFLKFHVSYTPHVKLGTWIIILDDEHRYVIVCNETLAATITFV